MSEVDKVTLERLLVEREHQENLREIDAEVKIYEHWRDGNFDLKDDGKYQDFEGNRVDDSLIREQYFENLRDWGPRR